MKTLLFFLFSFCFGYLSAQPLLKITYKEKSSDFASMKFISLSDSIKQFQYIQSENVPRDGMQAMLTKELVHHSSFSNSDSLASWEVVAYPINMEYLIRNDFPSEIFTITSSIKKILGYTCQKAISISGKDKTEVWFTKELGNYFGKSHAFTAPGVVLKLNQKFTRFKRTYIATKIEFIDGTIGFPNKAIVLSNNNFKEFRKGKKKLSELNENVDAVISVEKDLFY